jgi:hypothetical protein
VGKDVRVPPPTNGFVRVYVVHSVGTFKGQRWNDISEHDPRLPGWMEAGLVRTTGAFNEEAPTDLPARRCCGDN